MKKFGLIGAAGYIAPRHMKAIKDTGNDLIAAFDVSDSVGIIDSYFPNASFFTNFERFDRHIEKLKYDDNTYLDYISICSPNYLHDAHIRFALRSGANAICEKPLVINPANLNKLVEVEKKTGKKVYNILQLREHKSIIDLKNQVKNSKDKNFDIELTYITSRGKWYDYSWKGDIEKSGGLIANIGVHFFDMLIWIFGEPQRYKLFINNNKVNSGYLELKNARVRWFLSIDKNNIPPSILKTGKKTFRSLKINNNHFEFSDGFKDLHTQVYKTIISGNGYGISDAYQSINLINNIKNLEVSKLEGDYHPMAHNE